MGIWRKFDGHVYYCKTCIPDSCIFIKHVLHPKEMQACFNIVLGWGREGSWFAALKAEVILHAHKRNCDSNEN